ncbi:hypothetical protein, partial [Rhodococcus sp. FH8]|uniref:hypothetical protein n=1 Tax=Rhodococcus sp. FH8 TaxID=1761013 RepID=UPI001C4EFB25
EYRHVTRRSSCPSTETETASGTAVPEAVSTCPLTNFSTYQLYGREYLFHDAGGVSWSIAEMK